MEIAYRIVGWACVQTRWAQDANVGLHCMTMESVMSNYSNFNRLGAVVAGALMLFAVSGPASASFINMTFDCVFTGPLGQQSCGPTVPKDAVATVVDGHLGMWESWYSPGMTSVTISMTGTYLGPQNGTKVDYILGFDKDVVNQTGMPFYGFDILVNGAPGWEPQMMMTLPYVDTAGYFTPIMANGGGIWFDGMLPYGMTSKFWAAVMVPLNMDSSNNVWGEFTMYQIPKVPEPGTLALFGLGLAGLGFARRKKAA